MKFGHFDDANREYVITTPRTPLPWINYLGNQDFFTLISNTCGGYSFYKTTETESTYILRMETPSGIQGGSLPRPNWTDMSADTAWAIPASVLPKTAWLSASSTLSPWEIPAR